MAYDILNTVVDELVRIFVAEMQTAIDEADPLRLQLVERAPLQDDPTLVAPFIIVGVDTDRGRIPDPVHDFEIGGGPLWMNFFKIAGRIPQVGTKEEAYTQIALLNDRVLMTLYRNHALNGLTADNGERIFGCSPDFIGRDTVRPFGGESEWFGELKVELHFFSEVVLPTRL